MHDVVFTDEMNGREKENKKYKVKKTQFPFEISVFIDGWKIGVNQ